MISLLSSSQDASNDLAPPPINYLVPQYLWLDSCYPLCRRKPQEIRVSIALGDQLAFNTLLEQSSKLETAGNSGTGPQGHDWLRSAAFRGVIWDDRHGPEKALKVLDYLTVLHFSYLCVFLALDSELTTPIPRISFNGLTLVTFGLFFLPALLAQFSNLTPPEIFSRVRTFQQRSYFLDSTLEAHLLVRLAFSLGDRYTRRVDQK
ncbi:hypothetical protein BDZ89DRAFT_1036455 [Hymenopellis radicata]|nr:hypothetical protein BDZ89DRAFT_1036455 [Hymenopellis radicata]